MNWIPAFRPGVANTWLLMSIYPLQWLAVLLLPKRIAERTGHDPAIIRTRQDRVMSFLTQGAWIGATLYSIFLPLHVGGPWFWAGVGLFLLGLAILVLATVAVARTPANEPFTAGVYRFSRHPMYLSMILVYLGVSAASASWVFLLITAGTVLLQRHQMLREEAWCRERFGQAYVAYMAVTARWFGSVSGRQTLVEGQTHAGERRQPGGGQEQDATGHFGGAGEPP
jgi:protein-S-isoprenylcysteine O-methyltransferase Ste14